MDPVCRKRQPPAAKLGQPSTWDDDAVVQCAVAHRRRARQRQPRQSIWRHAHLHPARASTCGVPLHRHSICQPWSLRCPTRRRGSAKSWPPPCRGDGNCLGRNRLPDASTRNRLQHHIRTDERTEDRSASLALTADFHARPACSRPVCSRPVRSRPEASTSMTFNIGHT